MMGCGFVGLVAGLAGLRRTGPVTWRDIVVLAVVGAVTGFAYGALLDVWDWTTFYRGAPDFGWQPGLALAAALGALRALLRGDVARVRRLPRGRQRASRWSCSAHRCSPGLIRMRSRFNVVVLRSPTRRSARRADAASVSPT